MLGVATCHGMSWTVATSDASTDPSPPQRPLTRLERLSGVLVSAVTLMVRIQLEAMLVSVLCKCALVARL